MQVEQMRKIRQQQNIFPIKIDKLKHLIKKRFAKSSEDLLFTTYEIQDDRVAVFFLPYLTDTDKVEDHILDPLVSTQEKWSNERLINEIPIGESTLTNSLQDINNKLILGHAFVYVENEDM